MKITKRDVKFFILGFLTFFLIEVVFKWEAHKKSFREGWNDAKTKGKIESKAE
jgi:hypothetical protein